MSLPALSLHMRKVFKNFLGTRQGELSHIHASALGMDICPTITTAEVWEVGLIYIEKLHQQRYLSQRGEKKPAPD